MLGHNIKCISYSCALVIYWCITNDPKTYWVNIATYIISQFLWVRNLGMAYFGPLIFGSVTRLQLSQGLTWNINFLAHSLGCWQDSVSSRLLDQGLSSSHIVGWRIPSASCHIGLPTEHLMTWHLALESKWESKRARESVSTREGWAR